MNDRKLSEQEFLAIDSILDDAERKFLPKSPITMNLEELDQQCRNIWSDWDYSVPAYSNKQDDKSLTSQKSAKSPFKKSRSKIQQISISDDDDSDEVSNINSSSNVARQPLSESGSSDSSSEVEIKLRTPLNKTTNSKAKISFDKSERSNIKENQTSKSTINNSSFNVKHKSFSSKKLKKKNSNISSTSSNSRIQVEPYDRSDAARLRQDNISLRAQVTRLQAALDRANYENARLKEQLSKSKLKNAKQESIISYLKDQRLYGKK